MDITWYGYTCFRLKNRTSTVVTDPYDKSLGLAMPRIKANIVTISQPAVPHYKPGGVKGQYKVVDGPGEYEIGGTFITALQLQPDQKKKKPKTPEKNNIFVFYMDDIVLCHLGSLNHVPTQQQVEAMDNIDVLMIPVGGHDSLNSTQAAEVISLIEPYVVIPMRYQQPDLTAQLDPLDKFLKEMGSTTQEPDTMLRLSKSGLPDETRVMLMEAKT